MQLPTPPVWRFLLGKAVLLALAGFVCSCRPCGCKEATLIAPKGITLKIAFDYNPLPWVDDGFTITQIGAGPAKIIKGTYKNSGDKSIRFNTEDNAPFLSVKSGEINSLSCDEEKGQFTITAPKPAPNPGGGPAVPLTLTFQCTKN